MDNNYSNDACDEHRRKHTDIFVKYPNGKYMTMGEFAKEQAIMLETPFSSDNYIEKIYYAARRLVAKCTPESVHHDRRESRLDELLK